MTKELKTVYSAKERAKLLLSSLQKLKADVAVIEAQYDMKDEYTKICEDAILRIMAMKTDLERDLATSRLRAI